VEDAQLHLAAFLADAVVGVVLGAEAFDEVRHVFHCVSFWLGASDRSAV
jgi:hypothetical protein